MPSSNRGRTRRELGQNFLVDDAVTSRVVHLLELSEPTSIVELGAGDGALTSKLAATGNPVTAVELDPIWAARVRRRLPEVRVVRCDMLDYRFPRESHAVVGNLPYGVSTAMTRRLLRGSEWSRAVLMLQWDVARKRATGGSMLNAQWAPWYRFELCGRVPARAFRPVPSVDGGLLRIHRRRRPLLPPEETAAYQDFVEAVFTGKGRGIASILRRAGPRWAGRGGISARWLDPHLLPKDLTPEDWARIYSHAVHRD